MSIWEVFKATVLVSVEDCDYCGKHHAGHIGCDGVSTLHWSGCIRSPKELKIARDRARISRGG